MIIIKQKYENYIEIYSNSNKKIYEEKIDTYWNNSETNPLAVDKIRYENGEYVESEIENDKIILEVEGE